MGYIIYITISLQLLLFVSRSVLCFCSALCSCLLTDAEQNCQHVIFFNLSLLGSNEISQHPFCYHCCPFSSGSYSPFSLPLDSPAVCFPVFLQTGAITGSHCHMQPIKLGVWTVLEGNLKKSQGPKRVSHLGWWKMFFMCNFNMCVSV